MVSAEDAISLYANLLTHGIQVWVTGGWGIDALLGEETRCHKDLDVLMLLSDVSRMCNLMESEGYILKELWSENMWAFDAGGNRTATAFVLHDADGRELDAHAIQLTEEGKGIPMWENIEGLVLTRQYLSGTGRIAGFTVQCTSPEYQVIAHTGYVLPEQQERDLQRLHDKYKLDFPKNLTYLLQKAAQD